MSQQTPPRNDDQNILAITVLFGIVIALMFLVFANQPVKETPPDVAAAQTAAAQPTVVAVVPTVEAVVEVPADHPGEYTEAQVRAGTQIFNGLCFACHGQGGVGIAGLGKPLVGSVFVGGLTDDELVQFLTVGRQPTDPLNTTGQLMPARGGNPMLTDDDLYNVVAYIRSLNGAQVGGAAAPAEGQPSTPQGTPTEVRLPSDAANWTPPAFGGGNAATEATPTPVATAAVETPPAPEATAAVGPDAGAVVADAGSGPYARNCASCHGPAGEGVGGQAALVGMASDWDAFVKEITVPAPVGTVLTGFVHPYRGGIPGLSDAEIEAVVAYVQSLGG
jgi:mono/diheme cytochrome c family protein